MNESRAFRPRVSTIGRSRRSVALLLVTLGAGLVASPPAHADDSSEELTVEQFLARIQANLPELDLLHSDVLVAEAGLADARALPPLELGYEREEVFAGGEGVALKNAISLGWSVDPSGRRGHRARSAELSVEARRRDNLYAGHLVVMSALEVYYGAARARLRVASLRETRQPLARLVSRLENRVSEGDASRNDLARFELELSEHDDRLAEAEAAHAMAQTELAALLGLPGQRFEASDDLALPSLAQGSPAAREETLANRSDMQATELEARSGTALTRAAGRWWLPTLELSIGYLSTDFGPGDGPGSDVAHGYTGMLSVAIPLFSRGTAERKHGEARIRRAEAKRRILERQVPVEIQNARILLGSRINRTRSFEARQLVQAAELSRTTENAYQGGEASSLELRDAYRQVTMARLRHIQLRYQSRLAEIELWRAIGKRGGETK